MCLNFALAICFLQDLEAALFLFFGLETCLPHQLLQPKPDSSPVSSYKLFCKRHRTKAATCRRHEQKCWEWNILFPAKCYPWRFLRTSIDPLKKNKAGRMRKIRANLLRRDGLGSGSLRTTGWAAVNRFIGSPWTPWRRHMLRRTKSIGAGPVCWRWYTQSQRIGWGKGNWLTCHRTGTHPKIFGG